MTYDTQKAGRALDALIAEKVMGQTIEWIGGDPFLTNLIYEGRGGSYSTNAPRYSTDIAAAWEVVEKLGDMSVHHFYDPTLEEWFYHVAWRSPDGIEHHCSAEANTAPYAICLAALKAVRV